MPCAGLPLCEQHVQAVRQTKSTYEYSADGAVESHGYNCFKKRGAFPEMPTSLWPTGYSEGSIEYDRANELLRGPTPGCGRCTPPIAPPSHPVPASLEPWQAPANGCDQPAAEAAASVAAPS